MTAAPLASPPPIEEEDRARASLYALLARLYYRGPDAALLGSIAAVRRDAPVASALGAAWGTLAAAAAVADPAALQQEYDDLLVGTGKAEVTPYASYYLAESGPERILVRLREDLAELGLGRQETSGEPEDHVAGLFDVMRYLILEGDAATQQRFFGRFIERFYGRFCDAIEASERAEFYRQVAVLTRAFLDVEAEIIKLT